MNETTPSPTPAPASKPSPASTAGTKRKRGSTAKYYAVKAGYQPGVYHEWRDCLAQITGYKGAVCKEPGRPQSSPSSSPSARRALPIATLRWLTQPLTVQAFPTFEEANAFLTGAKRPTPSTPTNSEPSRFYGIQRGRVPGVYTDWAKAQEQIKGFPRPRYKKFATRQEAEAFVKGGATPAATFAGAPGLQTEVPRNEQGAPLEPGEGPLPPGAEDGFDPNLLLDPTTGKVVYKLKEQKTVTKTKTAGPPGMLHIYTDGSSLKNGKALAAAGVGVYFGPEDSRLVFLP